MSKMCRFAAVLGVLVHGLLGEAPAVVCNGHAHVAPGSGLPVRGFAPQVVREAAAAAGSGRGEQLLDHIDRDRD